MTDTRRAFNRAITHLPLCLAGAYDRLEHTTIQDLVRLAETYLVLGAEGVLQVSAHDRERLMAFVQEFRANPQGADYFTTKLEEQK